MRRSIVLTALFLVPAAAHAQTSATSRGYAEAVAQSAFGNVTSQSYGGEIGVRIAEGLQLFVDAGQVRNAAGSEMTAGAERIAAALNELQPAAVGFTVKQPITFGVAGLRYIVPVTSPRVEPYVLAGAGAAQVKNDVAFQLGGSNAAESTLSQYVTLGSDLSGTSTRPMLSLGVGVALPIYKQLIVDLQYRYGRVFAEAQGININRAGIGVGIRF